MKTGILAILVLILFYTAGYSETPPVGSVVINMPTQQAKTADVNKDGAPDVTYYREGKYVSKVEADTNYDGTPDIVVNIKDGKFDSAEADVDYDGKTDKKFNNAAEFKKWVNENRPDFEDQLNRPDWQFDLIKF